MSSSLQRDFLPDVEWAGEPVRVLVCDDHALFRRALVVALESEADLEIVAEADGGPEAKELADELAPDVIFVDMALAPYGGVAAISQIMRVTPTARVVIVAVDEGEPGELLEAVGAGAIGQAQKEEALESGADLVRAIGSGATVLSGAVAAAMRDLLSDDAEREAMRVTDRERILVDVLARGADLRAAATGLGVTAPTAQNLLMNLVRKLQRHWRRDEVITSLADRPTVDRGADVAQDLRE